MSSYKDQIKANIFAQLLSRDGILISYTEKNYDHFRKVMFFGPKNFWHQVRDTLKNPIKMGKYEVKTPQIKKMSIFINSERFQWQKGI